MPACRLALYFACNTKFWQLLQIHHFTAQTIEKIIWRAEAKQRCNEFVYWISQFHMHFFLFIEIRRNKALRFIRFRDPLRLYKNRDLNCRGSQVGHQGVTGWSPGGHRSVTRGSQVGHQGVTGRSPGGHRWSPVVHRSVTRGSQVGTGLYRH